MSKLDRVIIIWGVCDLVFVGWFIVSAIIAGRAPIYDDLRIASRTLSSFGHPILTVLVVLVIILYASILLTGFLLCQRKRASAIVCYIQTPLRIGLLAPSVFFLLWPLPYLFSRPPFVVALTLIIFSEGLKLASMVAWHRREAADPVHHGVLIK